MGAGSREHLSEAEGLVGDRGTLSVNLQPAKEENSFLKLLVLAQLQGSKGW